MPSVIVFSKDRPMQLHAYIESLLHFSDITQQNITVLYYKTHNADYSKTIKKYPLVNWISENNFYNDLIKTIDNSEDYIMFGCDDVVFINKFNTQDAAKILSQNEQIFGFSFRLGKNVVPFPTNYISHKNYLEWNWKEAKEIHYNYPWELCCTLYRKSDITEMLKSKSSKEIKNPNYFEGTFAENPELYIKRSNLACFNKKSQAIVITVNRVQETHPNNSVDDRLQTDIHFLNQIYNEQNNKLDIKAISKIKSKAVHVGSEYFILKNYQKNWKNPKIKTSNPLKLFLKNISYLFRYNLKKIAKESSKEYITSEQLNLILENLKYNLMNNLQIIKKPNIKSPIDTINDLIEKKPSFCRYGDGEFMLMKGRSSIPFQKYDLRLSKRLNEILKSNNENIFIGIPHSYYTSTEDMHDFVKDFMNTWVVKNRNMITNLCLEDKQYYDTGCTQIYAMFKNFDFESYFEKIKEIWKDRDIAIICGKTVFDKIKINIFDCAKSVEYQYAPSINAFDEYEQILNKAKQIDKNKLIIIILGPTATVLAYDLAKEGYQAIDFGHIAKDYDYYQQKINHSNQSIADFFKPD